MTVGSVVVVGAGLAGLSAARALRREGFAGPLTVVGAEPHRPYDRPPLSKEYLTGAMGESDLALEREDDDLGATWILDDPAVRLERRRVGLRSGRTLAADGFVLATGASARPLPGATTLRSLDDARRLRHRLRAANSVVVVGAGFIGAEVASAARALGRDVTVVEAAPAPLAGSLGVAMGAAVAGLHEAHGVRLICGVGVDRVQDGAAHLADGRVLAADVVVAGIGVRPETAWLAGSDLTDRGDGIECGPDGSTGVPGVVAVGDCAAWFEPRLGRHLRVEHWTAAGERAAIAARTLLGRAPRTARQPYFWSDQYGRRIQFAGHTVDGDEVTVEEGSPGEHRFLAVYRRAGAEVAVLAVDMVGAFSRRRRLLETKGSST
ncbi:NAD(P)/FAD-dependent oxidoreductase [Dactylosporangium sp. McL0621]|uniref:NAD(P)/FAD-dependent oxidoreductase n=1 Tax=Dactylosporangium sp. McL0621 TaxID=3415678 RepID=UPI003CFA57E8